MLAGFSFDLTGRTALVTGASSGTGRRFAEILAASGARVVLAARRVALLERLRDEIEQRGGQALAVAMDAADEASTIAAFDAAEAAFGPVDTVVANAGISLPGSSMGILADHFDQTMAVNVRGAFLTAREGARRMLKQAPGADRGRIVLISSITGHYPSAGVPYGASKAAVTQMGRALAREWAGKGINVNVIAPGYMLTELTEPLWEIERGQKLLESFPRARLMGVDALDPMLLYLCSDASREVTGSVFTIDDGQTL